MLFGYTAINSIAILISLDGPRLNQGLRIVLALLSLFVIFLGINSGSAISKRAGSIVLFVLTFSLVVLLRFDANEDLFMSKEKFSAILLGGVVLPVIASCFIKMELLETKWITNVIFFVGLVCSAAFLKDQGFSVNFFTQRARLGEGLASSLSPIYVGKHGAIVLLVLLYIRNSRSKLYFLLNLFLGLTLLLLSGSRGPLFVVVIMILSSSIIRTNTKLLVVAFSFALVSVLLNVQNEFVLFNRLASLSEEGNVRLVIWDSALSKNFIDLFFGNGYFIKVSFLSTYAHNLFLEVLNAGGLILLLWLLLNLIAIKRHSYGIIKTLTISYLYFSLFTGTIISWGPFFALLVLLNNGSREDTLRITTI